MMMMMIRHPLLFVLLVQRVALSSLLLLLLLFRTTPIHTTTTTSNSHVSFTSVMAWHRPTTTAVFTRRSSNYGCCSNDSQFIYMLSRGGGDGGDGDSSHNNSHMNNHIDGSADDMDHIQNSIDIPIETSFPTTTSSNSSSSSSSSNSNRGSMTLGTPPAVVDTVETTTAPPVKEKDIPPPPPPPAATSTTTAAVATVTTTNATVSAVVATAAVHRTALIQQIVTTLVTTTTTVKEHLSRTPQQIVQTTRIIYENLQPYIPRNTQYTLQLSQTHQHQHSILILMVASVLAMHSGYLNGLGLFGLATAVATSTSTTTTTPTFQAVAAVTSAYTNLGLQIARGNIFRSAMVPLRCIISYLMGSFVTGFIVHHVPLVPYEITTYPVSMIFAIGTMALFMASNLLSSNQLSMNIFYLLTFVNGLQNSFTSIYSHNQIRSSHYTGMTSDTGTYLGQYIRSTVRSMTSSHEDDAKSNDLTKTLLPKIYRNTILSTSFIVGGMLSYWISQSNGIQNAKSVLLPSLLLYMTLTLLSLLWKPIESSTNPLTSPV